jgi:hypothetical protein
MSLLGNSGHRLIFVRDWADTIDAAPVGALALDK